MKSRIAELIRLKNHPVAVCREDAFPEGALSFRPGVWGCVVALLAAAANGKTAAFDKETVVCAGGRAGLGLEPFQTGVIEYFLSVGGKGPKPGEFYKKSPELALDFLRSLPDWRTEKAIVFRPLDELPEGLSPDGVVFLVNADQLSGLVTLANYDASRQDNVKLLFGSGCAQTALLPFGGDGKSCVVGLTDPSARKCIGKDLLSFSIPYGRFLEMEKEADGSFLTKETWQEIAKRL